MIQLRNVRNCSTNLHETSGEIGDPETHESVTKKSQGRFPRCLLNPSRWSDGVSNFFTKPPIIPGLKSIFSPVCFQLCFVRHDEHGVCLNCQPFFDEAGVSEEVRKFIYVLGITKTAVFARVATSPAELKDRNCGMGCGQYHAYRNLLGHLRRLALLQCQPRVLQVRRSLQPFPPRYAQVSGRNKSRSTRIIGSFLAKFPEKVLIGSESVLARFLHEAASSRLFSPTSIGEILIVRAWASSGSHKQHGPQETR